MANDPPGRSSAANAALLLFEMVDAGGAPSAADDAAPGAGAVLVGRGGAVADVANYVELRGALETAGASPGQVSYFAWHGAWAGTGGLVLPPAPERQGQYLHYRN